MRDSYETPIQSWLTARNMAAIANTTQFGQSNYGVSISYNLPRYRRFDEIVGFALAARMTADPAGSLLRSPSCADCPDSRRKSTLNLGPGNAAFHLTSTLISDLHAVAPIARSHGGPTCDDALARSTATPPPAADRKSGTTRATDGSSRVIAARGTDLELRGTAVAALVVQNGQKHGGVPRFSLTTVCIRALCHSPSSSRNVAPSTHSVWLRVLPRR
eukprot:COSAG02_NODE_15090_length_1205_cov_1.084991_2_plen_217_part_00